MFCLAFRRNPWVLIKRKIKGSRKSRASRKGKQRKTADDTTVKQGCTAVHSRKKPCTAAGREAPCSGHAWTHGHLAWWRTVGHESWHSCAGQTPALRVHFSVFLSVVSFFFLGVFFGCRVLGRQLGFSPTSINPFKGRSN